MPERESVMPIYTRRTVSVLLALSPAITFSQSATGRIVRYALPEALSFPEGIAYDPAANAFYTASAATGLVIRLDVASGQSRTVVPAGTLVPSGSTVFPALLGMKLDSAGRLWLSGGRTGRMHVVDAKTGQVIKQFTTTGTGSLINDVAIAEGGAYFTDTLRPILWRVTVTSTGIGELEPWLDFTGTALVHAQGANLNGITTTAEGQSLIVGQMNKGLLFRIDLADRKVTPLDLAGETVTGVDGLWRDGTTLWMVRQPEAEIVTVRLSEKADRGTVVSRFKDPALLWPATCAKAGDHLLVVNTQFNKRSTGDP
jgi:sugar lactone lactonase YvrE